MVVNGGRLVADAPLAELGVAPGLVNEPTELGADPLEPKGGSGHGGRDAVFGV